MVPTTFKDCLAQIRLLKARWDCEPGELDDLIVDNMLAGLEAMAAGEGWSGQARNQQQGAPADREAPSRGGALPAVRSGRLWWRRARRRRELIIQTPSAGFKDLADGGPFSWQFWRA
jgi:hypothetical protein